jgi:hypothetical protein
MMSDTLTTIVLVLLVVSVVMLTLQLYRTRCALADLELTVESNRVAGHIHLDLMKDQLKSQGDTPSWDRDTIRSYGVPRPEVRNVTTKDQASTLSDEAGAWEYH